MYESILEIQAIPAEKVYVEPILTDAQTAALEGEFLTQEQIPTVLRKNVDVYCKQTGACLLKMRTDVIPKSMILQAYTALNKAGEVRSDNRGSAAGPITDEEIRRQIGPENRFKRIDAHRYRVIKRNGDTSKITRARLTSGSIVGFFGKSARHPYCRLTTYSQENFGQFQRSFPIIKLVDRFYEALMPEVYAKQVEAVRHSSQDFIIPDTSYSTVTVNKNFRTALHYDAGDFRGGFGNLVAIRKGAYTGSHTGFPQYGVGVDAHNGDIVLMDVHRLHGNTPRINQDVHAVRLALVMYFREDIMHCGTAAQELAAAVKAKDIKTN